MNEESATIALRKFRVQKNVKSGKGPLVPAGLLKLVKRFEETGKLEDRTRAGRPCLKEARAPALLSKWKRLRPKQLQGPAVLVKLPDDWAYHHHLSAIFFVESSSCTHTNCNRAMNFCQQIPHRGKHLRRPFFETQCPVNGWLTETVNAQRYLTLLRETVVPCLIQRGQIANVTFMQDGATSHTANPVKAFLIQTFGEDRIVSRRCRYPWPPRSPDLAPADFWLWRYLKSRVYLSGPSSLSELKDLIRREVSSIHPDVLHSTVAGFVTRLECLLPCGGGHVEHIQV
ncbi:DUF4817 domain-containing protein [Trichonephila clavipes]|nr:DUF4817 domain-containing protein [Trichonephila clavipes]